MNCSTTFTSSTLMSQSLHLVAKNIPGSGPPDGRCLSLSGVSGRTAAVSVSPCSSHGIGRVFSQVKIRSYNGAFGTPAFVCKANSGSHRRNSDYSRQGRQGQGYSRNRGRQNEERDSYETLDESELLTSSKNGALLSFPNNSKSQATAAPGPREKEIVELFRKVQAQLRERASVKQDKKVDTPQGKGRENETVDSLLKLLRKHSVEQGGTQKVSDGDLGIDQPEQILGGYNDDKSSSSVVHSNNRSRNGAVESSESSFTRRPPSSFRRRSPIPRVKLPPVDSSEDDVALKGHLDSTGEKTKEYEVISSDATTRHEVEPEPTEEEPVAAELLQGSNDLFDEEQLSEDEASDSDESKEEDGEEQMGGKEDLSTLKVGELRAMAKSRGIKGYSKMKKSDLVNLLTAGLSE
ncbi:unnamed protein product [Linum tenue]|uniref:Rho termination factor-like N-terminal domain-containing protein n=1 Tax=Linum tenue TaxID=586396 RepID=A0AAV0LIP4_9ROSI|nr:unnamed protein product [Linum tenue]